MLAQPVTPAAGAPTDRPICLRPAENVVFVWGQNQLGITDKLLKAGRKGGQSRVARPAHRAQTESALSTCPSGQRATVP